MTTHSLQPHRLSTKSAALGLTGAGLAVAAAFGVTSWLSSDGTAGAPGQEPQVVITDGARDSWEGRIGPNANEGVRDSWMPPGTTDRELARPR